MYSSSTQHRLSSIVAFLSFVCIVLLGLCSCQRDSNPAYSIVGEPESTSVIRVYFTKPGLSANAPGHPANVIAQYISQTKDELDVCVHELDSEPITQAILQAHRRGVQVRVVVETAYKEENGVCVLREAGIPVVDDGRDGALMHNKFLVFDRKAVWTGSMNFTENCTSRNDNHGIYIADEKLAENYHTKFRWMFEERKFGGLPAKNSRIPHPVVTLADGTMVENYFAPHDRLAEKIIRRIREAKSSIHFLAFSFTHSGIAEAILERTKSGVEVLGVMERRQAVAGHSMYARFLAAVPPVKVLLDGNKYNMHHKVIILDQMVTIAGSFNFSVGADRDNDENILIIHSRTIAQQFEEEFQRVLAQAR